MTEPTPPVPSQPQQGDAPVNQPTFDPAAEHQQRPKVRPVRGMPVQVRNNQNETATMMGLADARQISDRMVVTSPAVQHVLPLMDGSRSLDEIIQQTNVGLTRTAAEQLVAQLDDAGLIEGPRFQELLAKTRKDYDQSDILPPGTTAQFADALVVQDLGKDATEEQKRELGPEKVRKIFDSWIEQAAKGSKQPPFEDLPKAIIAPHIDFGRGWPNYAIVYSRMKGLQRPDRIIILGTNHFGFGTGVVGCDKGFQTPLGDSPVAKDVLDLMRAELGENLFKDRYDHEREHSVELQVIWLQHLFAPQSPGESHVPVFGALVHDPTRNGGESYDGTGVAFAPFVEALRKALATLPGRTLVVCSADLSHCGPAFGDKATLAGDTDAVKQARDRIVAHDRQMLEILEQRRVDDLITQMAWQQNPTRWCSIGNLAAGIKATHPKKCTVLNYAAAIDENGMTWVGSCAAAMW